MQRGFHETVGRVVGWLFRYMRLRDAVYSTGSGWLPGSGGTGGWERQTSPWEDMIVLKLDLERAIRALPPRQKEAVVRCCILGQPQWEAAERMGISQQGVSWGVYAAVRTLSKFFWREGESTL